MKNSKKEAKNVRKQKPYEDRKKERKKETLEQTKK